MDSRAFIKILNILRKEAGNWKSPVIEFMASQGADPFRILVSTMLSARTKDEVTLKSSNNLFTRIHTPEELIKLKTADIARLIYPVGFYKTKARHLKQLAAVLINKFNSLVPSNIDDLLMIPGVGRKTANLVLSRAFDIPAICVDTHVFRICNRLEVTVSSKPEETEKQLMKKIPENYWQDINTILVAFGQMVCKPVSPHCKECKVSRLCPFY
ncbi:MAG: hypothetical protein ACD_79C00539G0001, partial [uncultured bacterium]